MRVQKKWNSRKPIHPRNHYHRDDIDARDIHVTLNGVLQKFVIEANIRGKWVVRYVTDEKGNVMINKNKPTELLTEKVYGHVQVSRPKECDTLYEEITKRMREPIITLKADVRNITIQSVITV